MIHVTRRSSTASQSDSDKYGTLDDTDMSVNSLTSVNSISSLLREKLLVSVYSIIIIHFWFLLEYTNMRKKNRTTDEYSKNVEK